MQLLIQILFKQWLKQIFTYYNNNNLIIASKHNSKNFHIILVNHVYDDKMFN